MRRVMIWCCAIVSISAYSSPVTMTLAPTRFFTGPVNAGMTKWLCGDAVCRYCKTNAHLFLQELFSFDSTCLRRCGCHNFSEKSWLITGAAQGVPQRKMCCGPWCCMEMECAGWDWKLALCGKLVVTVRQLFKSHSKQWLHTTHPPTIHKLNSQTAQILGMQPRQTKDLRKTKDTQVSGLVSDMS